MHVRWSGEESPRRSRTPGHRLETVTRSPRVPHAAAQHVRVVVPKFHLRLDVAERIRRAGPQADRREMTDRRREVDPRAEARAPRGQGEPDVLTRARALGVPRDVGPKPSKLKPR